MGIESGRPPSRLGQAVEEIFSAAEVGYWQTFLDHWIVLLLQAGYDEAEVHSVADTTKQRIIEKVASQTELTRADVFSFASFIARYHTDWVGKASDIKQ